MLSGLPGNTPVATPTEDQVRQFCRVVVVPSISLFSHFPRCEETPEANSLPVDGTQSGDRCSSTKKETTLNERWSLFIEHEIYFLKV